MYYDALFYFVNMYFLAPDQRSFIVEDQILAQNSIKIPKLKNSKKYNILTMPALRL